MGHFWFLPIFLVHIYSFYNQINCQCSEPIQPKLIKPLRVQENYLTVQNIFYQKSDIKTGDVMECTINKIQKLESSEADIHVFTQAGNNREDYVFYPASKHKKCFSFEVRARTFPCIVLSSSPEYEGALQVILDYYGESVIQTKDGKKVVNKSTPGIVNQNDLRGFWIRWLDDQFLEVGHYTEDFPLLSYTLPEKLSINFIGIYSYSVPAEWILHSDPKCGKYNVAETGTVAETKCKLRANENLHTNDIVENLHKNNNLETSQVSILYQMKNQYENFKKTKFRSKEILLEYQRLIKQYFKKAEQNYNKINGGDSEVFCPLKAKTYNEIANEYFQFLEELQMELSVFKDPIAHSNENLITHYNVCNGCITGEY